MKKLSAFFLTLVIIVLVVGAVMFWTAPEKAPGERPIDTSKPADTAELSEPGDEDAPAPEPGKQEGEPEIDLVVNEPEYTTAKLCLCGDVVLHQPLTDDAYSRNGCYDYSYMFEDADDYMQAADYALCCLETTFYGSDYSGYPLFSSPDGVAETLVGAGIDFITTASNHCLDTWFTGLCRTLDVLDQNGIEHTGTYRSQEERDRNNGIVVTDVNGISIAILSFTYGTNGLPRPDGSEFCVNAYTTDYLTDCSIVNYELLESDMAAARALDTDVIAVFMHWGIEYQLTPSAQQEELADLMFELGADLVFGGHPHVPEPMELREITREDGSVHTGFLCYCLGNFISNQHDRYTNLTAITNIELTKNLSTGEVEITGCNWVPMYMLHPEDSGSGHYALLDIHKAIAAYESGDTSLVSAEVYESLKVALDDLHSVVNEKEVLK